IEVVPLPSNGLIGETCWKMAAAPSPLTGESAPTPTEVPPTVKSIWRKDWLSDGAHVIWDPGTGPNVTSTLVKVLPCEGSNRLIELVLFSALLFKIILTAPTGGMLPPGGLVGGTRPVRD